MATVIAVCRFGRSRNKSSMFYARDFKRMVTAYLFLHTASVGITCGLLWICGCRGNEEVEMREIVIARRDEGRTSYEFVAFVDPKRLDSLGVSEAAFRDQMAAILADDAAKFLGKEIAAMWREIFLGQSKGSTGNDVCKLRSDLPKVESGPMKVLLDRGVRVEVRRIEDGKMTTVSRLTISLTGIIEEGTENVSSQGRLKGTQLFFASENAFPLGPSSLDKVVLHTEMDRRNGLGLPNTPGAAWTALWAWRSNYRAGLT